MPTQYFHLVDRALTAARQVPPCPGEYFNTLFICPFHGTIWARVWYDTPQLYWHITARECAQSHEHAWLPQYAGSLISTSPSPLAPLAFAADWPAELVEYEFSLLLRKGMLDDRPENPS